MVSVRASLACFVAVAVILSITSGGFLHSIIPHDHSGAPTMWETFHAGLRHEEGSPADMPATLYLSSALSVLLLSGAIRVFFLNDFERRAFARDGSSNALRRGIVAYRRFG